MQLNVTGHHVDVTTSMKGYVAKKLDRIVRHSDHIIDVHCILTVEKLRHKAEAKVLLNGAMVYADAVDMEHAERAQGLPDRRGWQGLDGGGVPPHAARRLPLRQRPEGAQQGSLILGQVELNFLRRPIGYNHIQAGYRLSRNDAYAAVGGPAIQTRSRRFGGRSR